MRSNCPLNSPFFLQKCVCVYPRFRADLEPTLCPTKVTLSNGGYPNAPLRTRQRETPLGKTWEACIVLPAARQTGSKREVDLEPI